MFLRKYFKISRLRDDSKLLTHVSYVEMVLHILIKNNFISLSKGIFNNLIVGRPGVCLGYGLERATVHSTSER